MSLDALLNKERPNSYEAERVVVSAVMQKPKLLDKFCEVVTPEMFYNQNFCLLYTTLSKMYAKDLPIDIIEVKEQLKRDGNLDTIGGMKGLAHILDKYTVTMDAIGKALIIREMYIKRMGAEYGVETVKNSLSPDSSIFKTIDRTVERYSNLQSMLSIGKQRTELEAIDQAEQEVLDILEGRTQIIDTPFVDINKHDFFLQGKVLTICARPRMGKTAFAIGLAEYWSRYFKVHFISLEMNEQALQMRRMSYYSGVSIYDLYHDKELLKKASAELRRQTTGNISIDDSADTSTENLAGRVRQAVENGASIIILDYIQLLGAEGQDEVAKITNSTRLIQKLAKQYNVLFIQLAQLNRGSEGGDPKLKDIKGSGAIEEVSDYIWAIDRPEVYDPEKTITIGGDTGVSVKNMAKIISMKNRMGASDMCYWLVFQKEAMRFRNYTSLEQWEVIGNEIHHN